MTHQASAEASKFADLLKSLSGYDQLKNAQFPLDFALSYGRALVDGILQGWRQPGNRRRRTVASSNLFPNAITDALSFSWSLPDAAAVHAFRSRSFEVAHVQAAQSLQILQDEAANALESGQPWTAWRDNIELRGFAPENPYHLRTNFVTGVAQAQNASRWLRMTEDADLFPYLRYVAVMDDRVRDEHAALHGIVRRIDDELWLTHAPANGYNCRCELEQLTEAEAGTDPGLSRNAPEGIIDPLFDSNPGIDGKPFGDWAAAQPVSVPDTWRALRLPDPDSLPVRAESTDTADDPVTVQYKTDYADLPVYNIPQRPGCLDTLRDPSEVWADGDDVAYLRSVSEGIRHCRVHRGEVAEYTLYKASDPALNGIRKGILIHR